MKKLLTLLMLTITTLAIQAQTNLTRLHGVIKTADGKPAEAATLQLYNTADKKLAKLAITNVKGEFDLNAVNPGDYSLNLTAVGFEPQTIAVKIEAGKPELELSFLPLAIATKKLEDVTVTAKKPMVENKIDRTVVNVDAMISNAGSNSLEVLEKSPGVSIDKDGIISLKGKQSVLVLIDGKPSYLSGLDLANYLRNLPSNQLDQVEIMTQPPAKYDASGNGGVINIKTKKSKANGFNGSVSLSYVQGRYPKSPNSLNFNWRKNKINLFANYGFAYWEGFNTISIYRRFSDASGNVLSAFDQHSYSRSFSRNHTAKLGLDFFASKKTTFGVVFNGGFNPRHNYSNGQTDIVNSVGAIDSVNVAQSSNHDTWKNGGINLNFRQLLNNKGSEITADADYIGYGTKSIQNSNNFMSYPNGTPTQPSFLLQANMPSSIDIFSLKTDYIRPLKKDAVFEAGLKSSLVKTDNNALFTTFNHTVGKWEDDRGRSNHFLYDENINAAYVNYKRQFKKWGIQTGLRLENTQGQGKQLTTGETFTRKYTQLFPTLYISNKLNEKNTMVLNYGRRINRPNYQDMNPFQYFLDQFTYRQGNPYLLPQFSHNVELSHNYKGALNTTLNYTFTKDIINDILKQNDATKVTFQTKENIGRSTNIGLAVSYNAPITKWYTISFYANTNYSHFEGTVNNLPLDVSLVSWLSSLNNQFRFGKGWGAELSGFYRSKTQEGGLIVSNPMGVFNMAFSKQILKNKGSLKLAISDPLWLQRFSGYTRFGNINADIKSEWDNRRVGLTFTYRFGKQMQQTTPRRRVGSASEEQQRVGAGNGQQ